MPICKPDLNGAACLRVVNAAAIAMHGGSLIRLVWSSWTPGETAKAGGEPGLQGEITVIRVGSNAETHIAC